MLPDLIILDVMMPGEGGVVMYRQLKTDQALENRSGDYAVGGRREDLLALSEYDKCRPGVPIPGPDAYVEKPPEADILVATAGQAHRIGKCRLMGETKKSDRYKGRKR